jgi:midasin (ATPase involved in ribosome maturation)
MIFSHQSVEGSTSAAKSMTARVAAQIVFGKQPLTYALSEQTEVADLIGRKMLCRSGAALLSFIPGVLTKAYVDGFVLILDEFDLATERVLTCILSALDNNFIEAGGNTYRRHPQFRLVATLNGETTGFSDTQRNVLPAVVIARFRTISFEGMKREECWEIFMKQMIELPMGGGSGYEGSLYDTYKKTIVNEFVRLHVKVGEVLARV